MILPTQGASLLRHPGNLIPGTWDALFQLVDGAVRQGVAEVGNVVLSSVWRGPESSLRNPPKPNQSIFFTLDPWSTRRSRSGLQMLIKFTAQTVLLVQNAQNPTPPTDRTVLDVPEFIIMSLSMTIPTHPPPFCCPAFPHWLRWRKRWQPGAGRTWQNQSHRSLVPAGCRRRRCLEIKFFYCFYLVVLVYHVKDTCWWRFKATLGMTWYLCLDDSIIVRIDRSL